MPDRALVGTAPTIVWQPAGPDGEPATPTGPVTVTVTAGNGTPVVTNAATAGSGDDPRTLTLPVCTTLDELTAVWSVAGAAVAVTTVEIVGGVWFTVADCRAADEKFFDLAKYPVEQVVAKRAEVEAEFEEHTGQAWVPRYARVQVPGTWTCRLILPHVALRKVRSVTAVAPDGTETPLTPGEVAEMRVDWHGVIERPATWSAGRYIVEVEHGHDAPPADLKAAAIVRLRHRLNAHRSGIPDRATSMQTEAGQTYALATPGLRGFVTGIPEVDVVLERYRFVRAGVA